MKKFYDKFGRAIQIGDKVLFKGRLGIIKNLCTKFVRVVDTKGVASNQYEESCFILNRDATIIYQSKEWKSYYRETLEGWDYSRYGQPIETSVAEMLERL